MGSINVALANIDAFEAEQWQDVSWELDRGAVLSRLRRLVQHPALLDQRGLNACAPAVFFRTWFARDPVAAAAFTCTLLRDGSGQIGSLTVAPSWKLKQQRYSLLRSTIDAAHPNATPECTDWMVLSALRDSENLWFDYAGEPFSAGDAVAGITLPSTLASWFTSTGLYRTVDNTTTLVAEGDPRTLLGVIPSSDLDVVLFINATAIYDLRNQPVGALPPGQFFVVPNHYALLTAPFALSQDANWVDVDVWSWAKTYAGWQGAERFGSNYFGLIRATT